MFRINRVLWKVIALLLVVFAADVSAKDFVWRVRTNDSTVYLAGSIHALRATDVIPAAFDAAFQQSDRVVFELDLDVADSSVNRSFIQAKASYPSGQTIRSLLSKTAYAKLQNFAVAHHFSKTVFDRYRPWYVASGISYFQAQDRSFSSSYGVDRRYFNMAADYGKPRLYLETQRYQIRVLASTPDREWAAGIEPSLDDRGRSLVRLVSRWKAGNVSAVASGIDAGAFSAPNIYRTLLVQRNKNWLTNIQSYLSQSSTTMVVVGAAHLVGQKGLVKMLTNRGYEIRQMPGLVASNTFLTLAYETLSGTTNFIQATQESFGLYIAPTFVVVQTWFDLSVGAVGDGPISYQWFKDGVPLAGETNRLLHVENITTDHAGLYALESRNEFGSSLPARAQILVESPPLPVSEP